jgi:uncharacterized protein (TIGR00251 family)
MSTEVLVYQVRVIANASHQKIFFNKDTGVLHVRLTESPITGKANVALVRILANYFNVSLCQVRIVRGHKAKNKYIEIKKNDG